jgi:hypothetical protein
MSLILIKQNKSNQTQPAFGILTFCGQLKVFGIGQCGKHQKVSSWSPICERNGVCCYNKVYLKYTHHRLHAMTTSNESETVIR